MRENMDQNSEYRYFSRSDRSQLILLQRTLFDICYVGEKLLNSGLRCFTLVKIQRRKYTQSTIFKTNGRNNLVSVITKDRFVNLRDRINNERIFTYQQYFRRDQYFENELNYQTCFLVGKWFILNNKETAFKCSTHPVIRMLRNSNFRYFEHIFKSP